MKINEQSGGSLRRKCGKFGVVSNFNENEWLVEPIYKTTLEMVNNDPFFTTKTAVARKQAADQIAAQRALLTSKEGTEEIKRSFRLVRINGEKVEREACQI